MSDQNEKVPEFTQEQREYFQRQLAAQTGKNLVLAPELLTDKQRAQQAHETGDIEALKNPRIRAAFLQEFGVAEFGKFHLRATRERREKQKAAEQERLLAQRKARAGRI